MSADVTATSLPRDWVTTLTVPCSEIQFAIAFFRVALSWATLDSYAKERTHMK